jgi:glycosyltransferase involved in cell wall biosynthesis
MRVLIITQSYLPEMGALANRMYPLVRELVAKGHQVSVATGMPNYPLGKVFPEYTGKAVCDEEMEGARILRTHYYTVPRNQSKWKQLRSYLSFLPAAFRSGLRAGKVDVVFVTSPPIFPVVAAIPLARLRRAKLVFDIRDLWPDEIVACGAGSEGSLQVRVIRMLERWIYRSADGVACTTQAFIDTVTQRGVAQDKAFLAPNGADLTLFRPLPRHNEIEAALPFEDKFVVMYSGLMGIKHGLEVMLDAAKQLEASHPDMLFCFVGMGPRMEALQAYAQQLGLKNILFTGQRKLEDLPYLLARADVCVTTLLPEAYLEKIIAVKVFEYMACEKPVVAALRGESARVVEGSGAGIAVPPGDAGAMAAALARLYGDRELCREMGCKGRATVEGTYSRAVIASHLEREMVKLCS